ncbi:MAG: hypothetical protein Q9160_006941 [Pyrenula sp. 1 TL-2023]
MPRHLPRSSSTSTSRSRATKTFRLLPARTPSTQARRNAEEQNRRYALEYAEDHRFAPTLNYINTQLRGDVYPDSQVLNDRWRDFAREEYGVFRRKLERERERDRQRGMSGSGGLEGRRASRQASVESRQLAHAYTYPLGGREGPGQGQGLRRSNAVRGYGNGNGNAGRQQQQQQQKQKEAKWSRWWKQQHRSGNGNNGGGGGGRRNWREGAPAPEDDIGRSNYYSRVSPSGSRSSSIQRSPAAAYVAPGARVDGYGRVSRPQTQQQRTSPLYYGGVDEVVGEYDGEEDGEGNEEYYFDEEDDTIVEEDEDEDEMEMDIDADDVEDEPHETEPVYDTLHTVNSGYTYEYPRPGGPVRLPRTPYEYRARGVQLGYGQQTYPVQYPLYGRGY